MDFQRSLRSLGPLLVLTCLVQVWTVHRAVVPAQDSIRYLIVAQAMARDGFVVAVRMQPEQPLFPAAVWFCHELLARTSERLATDWALCLQLAATAPLVLSMIPIYLLFRRLHGPDAAPIGALLYGMLGGVARLGADGLSDSAHLLFFCVALWTAVEYFARWGSARSTWLLASGLSTGIALLARAEVLVVPLAVLMSVVAFQCLPLWRQPATRALRATGAVLLGLSLPVVFYGSIGPSRDFEAIAARLLGRHGAVESLALNDPTPAHDAPAMEPKWHMPGIGQLVFGKKDFSTSSRFRGYVPAAIKLFQELAQTLHYAIGVLALVGLWVWRRRLDSPLDRFMQLMCVALMVAALHLAARDGYLSTRHLLLLVVLALGWAGAGIQAMGQWIAEHIGRAERNESRLAGRRDVEGSMRPNGGTSFTRPTLQPNRSGTVRPPRWRFGLVWGNHLTTWPIAVLAVASCLGDLIRPLHASRGAHREAAQWLQSHAAAGEAVLDSRGWTALYTGRKTYRYEAAQAAFGDPALAYVVVEQAEIESPSRRGETLRLLLTQACEPAIRFVSPGAARHGVTVWRWHPERFAQLGVASYAR